MAPILRKNIYPTAPHHQHPQLQRQLRQPQPLQRDISPSGPLSDIGLNSTIKFIHIYLVPILRRGLEIMRIWISNLVNLMEFQIRVARLGFTRRVWLKLDNIGFKSIQQYCFQKTETIIATIPWAMSSKQLIMGQPFLFNTGKLFFNYWLCLYILYNIKVLLINHFQRKHNFRFHCFNNFENNEQCPDFVLAYFIECFWSMLSG